MITISNVYYLFFVANRPLNVKKLITIKFKSRVLIDLNFINLINILNDQKKFVENLIFGLFKKLNKKNYKFLPEKKNVQYLNVIEKYQKNWSNILPGRLKLRTKGKKNFSLLFIVCSYNDLLAINRNAPLLHCFCREKISFLAMSSYVLDRELLLNSLASARATAQSTTNWIDANSNTALLGATVYQRNTDNEFKRQMADLQDQLKMMKNDIEKKDKLISELSTYREIERLKNTEKEYKITYRISSVVISDLIKKPRPMRILINLIVLNFNSFLADIECILILAKISQAKHKDIVNSRTKQIWKSLKTFFSEAQNWYTNIL
ncbi:hypothetical protein BpHYR1_013038 [Brachionus plicatilis]|uniref:Uncharacterized protein n=1 Tax=Brachionus plicatilis TaxID=10195 RepID=A0A3M7SIQ5_BRAPC|nr:hypothetical protein BpHYR1_013038 [Brachionus plicatilis]